MALLLTAILPLTFRCTDAQPLEKVKMYMVNPMTGDNTFNVSNHPVGSAFTIEFYVGNVTDMVAWQIHLTYNRTLINYASAWFPDDNVFKQAIDGGAIPTKEISLNVDDASDMADLLIVMTCTYPSNNPQKHPVNVTSRGLLCKADFTVALHPASVQLEFVSQPLSYSSLHVTPPYYLADFRTSVETLSSTYLADGEPAVIHDITPVPEASVILLLIWIPMTLALILKKRRARHRKIGFVWHSAV